MRIEQRNINEEDVNICVLTGDDAPVLNKYFATNIFKNNYEITESALLEYFLSAFKGKIVDRLFELARESIFMRSNIRYMRSLLNNLAKNNPIMRQEIPDKTKWKEIIETYKKTKKEITAESGEMISFDRKGRINSSIKKVTNIYASRFTKKSALKNKILSCDLNSIVSNLKSYKDFKLFQQDILYFNLACKKLGIEYLDNPIYILNLYAAYLNALEKNETASDFSSWALPVLRDQEKKKHVLFNDFTREKFYNFLKTHDINITDFNVMFNRLAQRSINQSDSIDVQPHVITNMPFDVQPSGNTNMPIGEPSDSVGYNNSTEESFEEGVTYIRNAGTRLPQDPQQPIAQSNYIDAQPHVITNMPI